MAILQELNPQLNILDYQLPNNAKLVMIAKETFTWDPRKKHPNIILSNSNLNANKTRSETFQNVFGGLEMSSGRYYWEIKILKLTKIEYIEELYIGICRKRFGLEEDPKLGKFCGYMCQTYVLFVGVYLNLYKTE